MVQAWWPALALCWGLAGALQSISHSVGVPITRRAALVMVDGVEGPVGGPKLAADAAQKSSKHKGVCWNKRSKKWHAQLSINGTLHYLGYYTDEDEAALAVDQFVRDRGLQVAKGLNFPSETEAAYIAESRVRQKMHRPSRYNGVAWNRRVAKWRAQMFHLGKWRHLGLFSSDDEAARAVDDFVRAHGLAKAKGLHFPTQDEARQGLRARLGKQRQNASSNYIGVTMIKSSKKWVAQISVNKKRRNLGTFQDEASAAEAYDAAAAPLGRAVNFPDRLETVSPLQGMQRQRPRRITAKGMKSSLA